MNDQWIDTQAGYVWPVWSGKDHVCKVYRAGLSNPGPPLGYNNCPHYSHFLEITLYLFTSNVPIILVNLCVTEVIF